MVIKTFLHLMPIPSLDESNAYLDIQLLDVTQKVAAYAKGRIAEPGFETCAKETFRDILLDNWNLQEDQAKDWSDYFVLALHPEALPESFIFAKEDDIKRWREIYFKSASHLNGELSLSWGDKSAKVSSALLRALLVKNKIPKIDQIFPKEKMEITFSDGITVEISGAEEEFLVRESPLLKEMFRGGFSETISRQARLENFSSVEYHIILDHLLHAEKKVPAENALTYFAIADQFELFSLEERCLESIYYSLDKTLDGLERAFEIKQSYPHDKIAAVVERYLREYLRELKTLEEFEAILLCFEQHAEIVPLGSIFGIKLPTDADDTSLTKLDQFSNLSILELGECHKISCNNIGFPKTILTLDLSLRQPSTEGFINRPKMFAAVLSSLSSSLAELNLQGTMIGVEEVNQLARALPKSELRKLNLSNNKLNDSMIGTLASAFTETSIYYLDLSKNLINARGIATLASTLPHCRLMFFLNLSDNGFGDEGVKKLVPFLPATTVSDLELANNGISDLGVKMLAAALTYCFELYCLNLSGNGKIGDLGVKRLASVLPGSSLKELNLAATGLGPVGAQALVAAIRNSKLTHIVIADNPLLSDQEIKALENTRNIDGKQLKVIKTVRSTLYNF